MFTAISAPTSRRSRNSKKPPPSEASSIATSSLTSTSSRFDVRVKGLDLGFVLVGDRAAFELHRRGQLVASRLPVDGQQLELLHLLDAGEAGVAALDPG